MFRVIGDYTSSSLNLADPATFRPLNKPIGALTQNVIIFLFHSTFNFFMKYRYIFGFYDNLRENANPFFVYFTIII